MDRESCRKEIAWYNKGVYLGYLSKYNEAIDAFNNAIAINPQDANAWNAKGNALTNLRKDDEAIKAYDNAISIDSQFASA